MASALPEKFASKLLTCLNQRTRPIPVEEIASALGLEVRGVKTSAFECNLLRNQYGAGGVIAIGGKNSDVRRLRFTIAHEIGHYVMERRKNSVCVFGDLQLWNQSTPAKEAAANRFAAELLLPSNHVGPIINRCGVSMETAKVIKEAFKTSLTSSAIRCVELTSQECALVYIVDGIVKSYRPSKAWRPHVFTGCPVGKSTLARKLLQDQTTFKQSGRVNALAWVDGSKFVEIGAELLEDSTHLLSYKTILSFLTAIR